MNINLHRNSQGTERTASTEVTEDTKGTKEPASTEVIEDTKSIEEPESTEVAEDTKSIEEPESIVNNNIALTWDASVSNTKDIAGYKIYYGTSQGNYTESVDVGKITTYKFKDMPSGTWYFVITAYDTSGNESGYSDVVSKTFE